MKSFDEPSLSLGDLDAEAAGRLIAASSDVALIVDGEGIIRDLAFGNDELSKAGYQDWLGKSWAQTVTVESRPKVEALLRELGGKGAPKWRHINHPSADGADLPLLYAAVPVGSKGHALAVGRSVAFGRDLRANAALQQRLVSAQQSMERDYWRMRHMETRYRVLFQVSSEPVLILDAATLKLEDANPAASKLLGDATQRAGWALARAFDAAGQAAVDELFAAVRATGRSDTVKARLGKDGSEWTVSASLFRQEKSSHFLVRLSALRHAAELPKPSPKDMLLRLVESAPDGFVVTDLDGLILTANQAFLDLAQLATEEQARGVSLEKWLGRTGVDLSVLISNLRQRGAVRLFATSMRGEYGSTSEVEISAVAVTEGEQPCLGFTIRDVGRRLPSDARASREVPRSVGQMTELVGRVPLREIVRDTTDLIEQLCIEAALQLTRDNRASAAEMLGLSRQSLYVKLRRYGLGDATVESES
ncbi:transcriptional regulator PpsR [Methylibium sp.]|uniref:transcriptional regulator PpsR n=1 Tax=Methylibium sp. TaxID=2067992 RepID=UPI00333E9F8B